MRSIWIEQFNCVTPTILLERQLSRLAARWRGEHSTEQYEQTERTVRVYHAVMTRLLEHDWLPNLDPDEELPEELMPATYERAWALRLYEQKVVDLRQTMKKLHITD